MHRTHRTLPGMAAWAAVLGVLLSMIAPDVDRAVAETLVLPNGFSDTLFTFTPEGYQATALAFLPDGGMLIGTQPGKIFLHRNNALQTTPVLDLEPITCFESERGLVGMILDPGFASNRYLYVYYTFKKAGICPLQRNDEGWTDTTPVNRLARFVVGANNMVDPQSQTVLIDNIPSTAGYHNAGDLRFGKDGYLYITTGDGGCDYVPNRSGCAKDNKAAADEHILLAKVLRVTRDGNIPADNPYANTGDRCNTTGRTIPGRVCQETFASGLRNPFRAPHDPNTPATRFFINDVGQGFWEEVNLGQKGVNYGWPWREGRCKSNSKTNCGSTPPEYTDPIFDYVHNAIYPGGQTSACNAIAGGTFIPNGTWRGYDNTYFYADYVCGAIFTLRQTAGGTYESALFSYGMGVSSVVDMMFGPHKDGTAMYYTRRRSGKGQVRVIAFAGGTTNRPPTAQLSATPTFGDAPLTVSFDGAGSADPDGDPLTYLWDFGDGSPVRETASRTTTYVYAANGAYQATLRVRDTKGATSDAADAMRIDVGNSPPVPEITAPASSLRFKVGQKITLGGRASDPEDGTLSGSSLSWEVLQMHNEHSHPFLQPTSGSSVTITAPPPEDMEFETINFLRVTLTATDSRGRSTSITRDILPNQVVITLDTQPSGLELRVNGDTLVTPRRLSSFEDYTLNLEVPRQTDRCDRPISFKQWVDGSTATKRTIETPASNTSYTAQFGKATGKCYFYFPTIRR
jgi:glucose/arabinose dehydrogenase